MSTYSKKELKQQADAREAAFKEWLSEVNEELKRLGEDDADPARFEGLLRDIFLSGGESIPAARQYSDWSKEGIF